MNAALRHLLPKIRKGNKTGLQPEVERRDFLDREAEVIRAWCVVGSLARVA